MGVYIEVLIEHKLPRAEVEQTLAEMLAPIAASTAQYAEIWKHWSPKPVRWPVTLRPDPPPRWDVSEYLDERCIPCLQAAGPHGISIDFWPRIAVLRLTPKWGAFVSDPLVESAVRSLCHSIARHIGAGCLLYVPDSTYCSSRALELIDQDIPLEAIVDWLQDACGPPFQDIPSIHRLVSDKEMDNLVPDWRDHGDFRLHDADGYFVEHI
jgi:hypothetical protein